MESKRLWELEPGKIFRKVEGGGRYVVSRKRKEHGGGYSHGQYFGRKLVRCYNLDSPSENNWYNEAMLVVVLEVPPKEPEVEMETQPPTRFWMCYVTGGNVPNHKHYRYSLAQAEAERLAKLTGRRVYVLVADQTITYKAPVTTGYTRYEVTKEGPGA